MNSDYAGTPEQNKKASTFPPERKTLKKVYIQCMKDLARTRRTLPAPSQ